MSLIPLRAGFMPLVDCAPLAIAREIGFAEEEGLALDLVASPSWSALRDKLAFGRIDAAHMLAPVPVAMAIGLGGMAARFDVLSVMSMNGNVIGVSQPIAARLRAEGHGFGFDDAVAAGRALIAAAPARLRMGVPFPFSMHAELVYHWLGALGIPSPAGLDVRTVPPPVMADALAAGDLDAFCVGEPWGSVSVENGDAALVLPGAAIWAGAPEKVLAVRHDWHESVPHSARRLVRAVWRAQRWLAQAENLSTTSEILARPAYVGRSAEIIERALTGHLFVAPGIPVRPVPGFLRFFEGAAGFPWRSQAALIAHRLAVRNGLDRPAAVAAGAAVFRSDVYRSALDPLGVDLPGASSKVEGAITTPTAAASRRGTLTLWPDQFFDRTVFDPEAAN